MHDEGGNSLTNKAKHDCLYKLMEKYGRLDTACREWRFKTTALKTWDLRAKHFTKHIKDWETHSTAKSQGYNGANASKTEATLNAATDALYDTKSQISNLACQSNDKRNTMSEMKAPLSAANTELLTL